MNRLQNDFSKDYFDLKCGENNTFEDVEWPVCKDSKYLCKLYYKSY